MNARNADDKSMPDGKAAAPDNIAVRVALRAVAWL